MTARPRWNHSGVLLARGGRYRLTADGTWHDAGIAAGPDGYPSPTVLLRATEWLRRSRRSPWFALIGTIDRRQGFLVGRKTTVVAPASGELVCYANDAWLMYFNNRGAVALTVTRVG
ncbi:MAG: hypothetical protein QOJ34_1118 [Pseudonocardiales bacterium]|nr:hypothetical protein [Pseudonocardiales bacterium]